MIKHTLGTKVGEKENFIVHLELSSLVKYNHAWDKIAFYDVLSRMEEVEYLSLSLETQVMKSRNFK